MTSSLSRRPRTGLISERKPTDGSSSPWMSQEQRDRLQQLAGEMERAAILSAELWQRASLDPAGGVHGFLSREFKAKLAASDVELGPSDERIGDKSLIQQARHLYTYSFLTQRRGPSPRLTELCESLLDYLLVVFAKPDSKLFANQVNPAGRVIDERVQVYAQSFAIFGLSTYALAFAELDPVRSQVAGRRALAAFEELDALRHDEDFGGYRQLEDGGWMELVGAPAGAEKCTNTHIHVLEALTPLLQLFPEQALVRARLTELVRVISTSMKQPSGYVHKHFSRAFVPVGTPEVSYGHDLETSWLIRHAARLLTREDQDLARTAAREMAEHALRQGVELSGGIFDYGIPEGVGSAPRVQGEEMIWWAQAEALVGIVCLLEQTHDLSLLEKLEGAFRFLMTKNHDPVHGDFYWGVMKDGSLGPRGDHKGEIWKTPYHAIRGLVLASDGICELLESSS